MAQPHDCPVCGRKCGPSRGPRADTKGDVDVDNLARFADENPNPILRVNVSGEIRYANDQSEHLLQCWDVRVGGSLPPRLGRLVREAHDNGESALAREVYKETVYELTIVPISDTPLVHLYCVDVTERERAQERVRDLARFPDENPNPVLRADAAGTILYANAGSRRLLEEMDTQVGGRLPPELATLCRDVMASGEGSRTNYGCCGRTFSFDFFPVRSAGYLNIYARDITESDLAEQQIRDARDQAVRAQADLQKTLESLEQRTHDFSASMQRLDEDAIQHRAALAALADLKAKFLSPLSELLGDEPPDKETVAQIRLGLNQTMARLAGLHLPLVSDDLVANKRVLLAESNTKRRALGRIALRGLALELDVVESVEEGMARLANNHYDVVCCSEDLVELCTEASKVDAAERFVLMTHRSIAEALPMLVEHPYLTSLVARYDDHRHATLRNIATTVQKLASMDFFGIEKYLSWGTEVHEVRVSSSERRGDAVAALEQHLREAGIRRTISSRAGMIAEELLMNAIYDAPTQSGSAKHNHLDRTVPVQLATSEEAALRWGFDGNFLTVSVEDPFGALSRDVVLGYLEGCYGGGAGTLNSERSDKGGAGMGLFQIMRNSALMIINVHAGRRTEVIAVLDLESPKQNTNGSLHFFFDK